MPFTTVVALYFMIAVGIGVSMATRATDARLSERIVGEAGMTTFALIFGVFFLLIVASAMLTGELVGAGSGYLVARRLSGR